MDGTSYVCAPLKLNQMYTARVGKPKHQSKAKALEMRTKSLHVAQSLFNARSSVVATMTLEREHDHSVGLL